MSTKDNFAQAMKELLNGEEAPQKDEKKGAPSSFSSFSQPEAKPSGAEKDNMAVDIPEPETDFNNLPTAEEVTASIAPAPAVAAPPPAPAPAPAPKPAPAPVAETRASIPQFRASAFAAPSTTPAPLTTAPTSIEGMGETTVVAAGTTIVGDITTSAGLRVGGEIKGNLKVASMIELNGKVIGDIEASDAVIVGSTIRGNVNVTNVLTMDGETVVVGDVSAKNVDINGKIKGNLSVEERGHFQENAVLVGNLMSGTVIIDEGAMLKGDISITSAQTENVTVDEPDFDIV